MAVTEREFNAVRDQLEQLKRDLKQARSIADTALGRFPRNAQPSSIQQHVHPSGGSGGAPTDADYLIGTANADLSAEIVVGTTPGGELGGTWGSPTVDGTHSGSAHHTSYTDAEAISAVEGEATLDLTGDATIAVGKSMAVDTIAEKGAGTGVTIDGVLIKDTTIDLNGTANALILDANGDTHISAPTADKIDFASGGTDRLSIQNTGLRMASNIILNKTVSTIDANGEIALPATGKVSITSNSGTADNLDGIGLATEGTILFLHPTATHDITLVHDGTVASGFRALLINGEANVTLDQDHDLAIALFDSSKNKWMVMVPGSGGGGGQDLDSDTLWAAAGDLVKGTGNNTADILSIGADHTVLRSNGTTASWVASPPLASIAATDDSIVIKFSGSLPNVEIDDTLRVEAIGIRKAPSSADTLLDLGETKTLTAGWTGINIAPNLTLNANNLTSQGISGIVTAKGNSGVTGEKLFGLGFQANAQVLADHTSTFAEVMGVNVLSSMIVGTAATSTLNITEFASFNADLTFNIIVDGVITITNGYGLHVNAFTTDADGTTTVTTYAGVWIDDQTAPTTGYGLYIEDANTYAIFCDAGLNRFDGDGTDVFELPADATDPTSGGGAATGRIPVKIGGSTVYLAYY